MPDYIELVDLIVRRLVTKPEEVKIAEDRSDSGAILLTIKVAG